MARQVDLISLTDDIHYLEFGLNNNELSSFSIQMWVTKYGVRMCDWVQAMGLNFISFMGADLWIHNDEDADRCNLFGEKRDCIIGVVSNEQPLLIKMYDSLGVHTDGEWEVMEITVPPTLNYPDGMYSKIPAERFKKRQGIWQAEFLRNMKTSSSTASILDAINGEHLRGHAIYMKLRNTSNDEVKLFRLSVAQTNKMKV